MGPDEVIPDSPLSSLTTLSTPQTSPRTVKSIASRSKVFTPPPHTAFVSLPRLHPRKRLQYRPLEVVVASILHERSSAASGLRPPLPHPHAVQGVKRKRTTSEQSKSSSDSRPLKMRAPRRSHIDQLSIVSNDSCAPQMSLDVPCLQGADCDKLRPYWPYVRAEIDTLCEDHLIHDKIAEPVLDAVLLSACRHVLAWPREPVREADAQSRQGKTRMSEYRTQETNEIAQVENVTIAEATAHPRELSPPTAVDETATLDTAIATPLRTRKPLPRHILNSQDVPVYDPFTSLFSSPERGSLTDPSVPVVVSPGMNYASSSDRLSPFAMHIQGRDETMHSLPVSPLGNESASDPDIRTTVHFPFTFKQTGMQHFSHGNNPYPADPSEIQDIPLMTWDHITSFTPGSAADDGNSWAQYLDNNHSRLARHTDMNASSSEAVADETATIDPSLLAGPSKPLPVLSQVVPTRPMTSSGLYGMDLYDSSTSNSSSPRMSSSRLSPTPYVEQDNSTVASYMGTLPSGQSQDSVTGKGRGKIMKKMVEDNSTEKAPPRYNNHEKGKRRDSGRPAGYPREYYGWALDVNKVASELSEGNVLQGKRSRKPTARLQGLYPHLSNKESNLTRHDTNSTFTAIGDTTADGKTADSRSTGDRHIVIPSVQKTKSSVSKERLQPPARDQDLVELTAQMRLSVELASYCHQCRNKNRYEKMRCTKIKDGGIPCGLVFCHKCILLRCVFYD